jgi:molybdenum cofactor cytidylyltransferase
MGRPKAALPLADRADTFLSRLIRTFTAAGLPDIVVVTGAACDVVRLAAGSANRRVRFIHNAGWESGQLSSIVTGLEERAGERVEAALVTLVDVPFVRPDTITRVLRAWRSSRAPIVRPARNGEHGHPVIFDRAIFQDLRDADPRVGAKSVIRARAGEILDVPVDDAGAFLDMDTEHDYRTAVAALGKAR